MRNIELHTIENSHDFIQANEVGLDVSDNETCSTCFDPVGEDVTGQFIPFAVLLDDESEWIVCLECADPVL
jgi:hypothetical protein